MKILSHALLLKLPTTLKMDFFCEGSEAVADSEGVYG